MLQTEPTPEQIRDQKPYLQLGLTEAEYALFTKRLGRLPNYTEVGLQSGMWSEHCAYKYSKPILKTFWTKNERVLMGPGEGAGVIAIGEGKAVVFKAESHNHPSAVEPYEGAATGIGGIIRDIFSIGAKPVASLDSLAFGTRFDAHNQNLIDQVVAGIGGYGNAIGIPTVGGEIQFDASYQDNPLVNAMCVGVMDEKDIQRGQAAGVGNAIIYVGAKTGRDGINGASFASAQFSKEEDADRSAVQVGDPFMEKLLTDACLAVTQKHQKALVGMQDMGAAGLVSSSAEMASKAGFGMTLDLDLIPQREPGMTPFEIMLSESQERMLLCIRTGFEQEILDLFAGYDLDAVVCGRVEAGHQYRLLHHGAVVCDIPVGLLTDAVPTYTTTPKQPARLAHPAPDFTPTITDIDQTLRALLALPNIASKRSLFKRYDAQVQTNTVIAPGGDAGVIRVRGTHRALAMTADSNGRLLALDPEIGGAITVAEAARNLVATGAEPLGITDCLNYGDPSKPEVYYELQASAKGIVEATKVFNTPVISGNVSLYNETSGVGIHPTPMIGMVGLITDLDAITTVAFKQAGDVVFLVGATGDDYNGSSIQYLQNGAYAGRLTGFDLTQEKAIQDKMLKAIQAHLVNACHDLADGGLAAALVEMGTANRLGIKGSTALSAAQFFAETQGRFLAAVPPAQQAAFAAQMGKDAVVLGTVSDGEFVLDLADAKLDTTIADLAAIQEEALAWQLK
ncbi:phosphoribosylformylglycinamidine synthase subunit PurL [Lacticaseibacillus baoqingensis]|uniref:Phosphoribosylformylglycinamidine synthase subunit PurL n=1 Tax=Lacticaseibacillus baoqingensis TaxID=2486013 RepID=A0ABW4E5Q8_9LACO|nr:phosphoribosylformylglycinamidine synthase subunit PurL [Lacticaseibacillus baoqingensis]